MTASSIAHDPVSPFARKVISLFAEQLSDVRFPDLDLSVLEAEQEGLLAVQAELAQIDAERERVLSRLEAQLSALDAKASRALSYARIYAEGDPALSAELSHVAALAPGRGSPEPTPKKRGRPRKHSTESNLFESHTGDEDSADLSH